MACEKTMELDICQVCGNGMQSGEKQGGVNYQKQVDPPIPRLEEELKILPNPIPTPPGFIPREPTIVHTSTIEYRVTGTVTGKDANQSGVTYIMNHGVMDRADVEAWVEKKKRMAEQNLSWVGDGTYLETRPQMLHFFGNTTHMFLPNPEEPYGNSPRPLPVCKPRDGLDH